MTDRRTRVEEVASAVADGAAVDWDLAESSAASDFERRQIQHLRLVGRLASESGVVSSDDTSRLHESFLRPSDDVSGAETNGTTPVAWGPLRVIEKIGRGRFGDVFRAWDPRLDREVALKLLRRHDVGDDEVGSLAIEEGRLLAKVRHPNVVTLYGAERIENRIGLWMELVEGRTLEEVVRHGPLTAHEAVTIGVDVCQALNAVHRAGLLHRDIKAQNVMREESGRVVLMDFGTGRESDDDAPEQLAGTPLYLAPEVLQGAPATPQSDIYSVGVLLYHLVTGVFPVSGRTLREIRESHERGVQPSLDHLAHLPGGLRAIIARALARDPGARFTSAIDMTTALNRIASVPAPSRARRRIAPAAIVGGLAVLILGAYAVSSWFGRSAPSGMIVRQIWTGADVAGPGPPSTDGRYLTFLDPETGDLAIRDVRLGTNRRLTDSGGWVRSGDYVEVSVISPDGRWVAYEWFVSASDTFELRVLPTDTSDGRASRVVLRTDETDFLAPIGWMPDGREVAVMRRTNGRHELGVVTIADGTYRTVTTVDRRLNPGDCGLSPDGRHLAYAVPAANVDASPRDIFIVDTAERPSRVAVESPADEAYPVWAPDGSGLLFLSDRTGTMGLWKVPVSDGTVTGPARLLKPDTGPIALLGMTRAGALYYLVSGAMRQNVYVADLQALRVTTTPARVSERFVNSNIGPAWSSDGEHLAYYSFRTPRTIVIRSTKTGIEQDVTVPGGLVSPFQGGPRWFPDNRSLLILRRDPGEGPGFYRLWLDTAKADLLHRGLGGGATSYALSPDGRTIYYALQNARQLVRYDIPTRRRTVLKSGEWFISVGLSPDGNQLAYLKSVRERPDVYSSVEVMPSAGGAAREVYRDTPWASGARYNTLTWTPDGNSLLFVRDDGRLWTVPARGGEPRDMGISMNAHIKTPAIHPHGGQIAFGAVETDHNEVWVMENLVP